MLKFFDRIFLSVPLTIFLILSLGLISLLGVTPSLKSIFSSPWFLAYLCGIVVMMLYCSVRRWPWLIKHYCYNRHIFSGPKPNSSYFSADGKDIFNLRFDTASARPAPVQLDRIFSKRGYRKTASREGESGEKKFFYEKAKLNIFGAHVVHLAVAVLLLAGIVTAWGGKFYDFTIREGETVRLEGTDASLTLEKFVILPSAEKEKADEYASRLRINRPGKPIEWQTVKVNRPLRIDGVRLFQIRFNLNIEKLRLGISRGKDNQPLKSLSLGLDQRVEVPELNIAVELKNFMPDFSLDKNNQVTSRSHMLKNPAAYLLLYSPAASTAPAEQVWIFRGMIMPHGKSAEPEDKQLHFMLDDIKVYYTSGIKYARNPGEYLTYAGLIILVAGSFLSTSQFYRGLLVTVKEDAAGAVAAVSARAMKCKNVFTLEKEITIMVNEMKQGANRA